MRKLLNRMMRNVVNIPGWSTKRRLLVIESDDWGSTRVRSNEDTKALEKLGFDFAGNSFYQFDGLESNRDVEGVMEVLSRHKDIHGNNPVFTLVCNVANPDFEKIRRSNFEEYFWESTLETYAKYPCHDKAHGLLLEGMTKHLFEPVFHGREHLNVQKWMRLLRNGNPSVLSAFEHGGCSYMYGIGKEYIGNMPAAFDLEYPSDLEYQKIVVKEGLEEFKHIWKKGASYFVSPNGPINNALEPELFSFGVNALLGEKRVIVSDISGTTRDSIDSRLSYNNQDFVIVDTAGIRKKSKVDYGVEKFAVDRAIRSIRECDVALLVIDATDAINGISDQDKKIASIITEAGKGMIIAINKWDLIEDKKSNTINKFEQKIANEIPFLDYVPKIYISAVTHQRLNQIFTKVVEVQAERTKRVSTGLLNKIINEAYALNPPQTIRNKRLKIMYSTQAAVEPPTFILFANNEELLKEHYKRYLENKLREAFGFVGTSIRISVRTRSEKKK